MTACSVCTKQVVSMSQAMMNQAQMVEMMAKTGLKCSSCGTISCQSCAHDEAKRKGNNFFTCPECAANIQESQIR